LGFQRIKKDFLDKHKAVRPPAAIIPQGKFLLENSAGDLVVKMQPPAVSNESPTASGGMRSSRGPMNAAASKMVSAFK
jgi:hypothetical protein